MSFTIKAASRQGVKPLVALYSESGCGKTYSSLLLARGFVGPSGKICLADSERGRGSLYADVLPGGYDVLQLDEPFTPKRYIEAIQEIEAGGYSIGIIDSGSHEWEGTGGINFMASEIADRTGKSGLHCWKEPKFQHALFVSALMRSSIPWVVCLRAKHKSRQVKDQHGKTQIVKDDHTSPIQAEDFIFEMTAHGEIMSDHSLRLTKWSHPELKKCFPDNGPITIEHGAKLAAWCGGTAPKAPASKPAMSTADLKKELWELTREKHCGNPKALEQWLIDQTYMAMDEKLASLSSNRLSEIITRISDPIP